MSPYGEWKKVQGGRPRTFSPAVLQQLKEEMDRRARLGNAVSLTAARDFALGKKRDEAIAANESPFGMSVPCALTMRRTFRHLGIGKVRKAGVQNECREVVSTLLGMCRLVHLLHAYVPRSCLLPLFHSHTLSLCLRLSFSLLSHSVLDIGRG